MTPVEEVNAKVLAWHMERLEDAKRKLEEAQRVVFELTRLIAWIERREPRVVEDGRAALHMTPRGAEWN